VFLEGDHVYLGDFGLAKDISQKQAHQGDSDQLDQQDLRAEMTALKTLRARAEALSANPETANDSIIQEGLDDTDVIRQLMDQGFISQGGRLNYQSPTVSAATLANLTLGVGTLLYASPEQLSRRKYDSKTDIYSLGVLFFELFWPVNGAMERVVTLMELRKGKIPSGFEHRWPKEYLLLQRLIAQDPTARPTAMEILGTDVVKSGDALELGKKRPKRLEGEATPTITPRIPPPVPGRPPPAPPKLEKDEDGELFYSARNLDNILIDSSSSSESDFDVTGSSDYESSCDSVECEECREKDMIIMALRERNMVLMEEIAAMKRE
jgi:serine/threonine protein kinase